MQTARRDRLKHQVLFIQGGGEHVHDEWDNKLVDSLRHELGSDYEVRYPRMPNESDPHYASWKPVIEKEIRALDDGAVVVGHSMGAAMLINMLAENEIAATLQAAMLISAPFIGEGGWPSKELQTANDLGSKLPSNLAVHIFHGLDDEEAPPQHADLYERAIPQAMIHRLAGRDHQFNNDLAVVAAKLRSLNLQG